MARHRGILPGIITLLFSTTAVAQSGFCPPNMDFEMGDFTNWTCRAGSVSLSGGVNTVNWATVGPPVFDRHTIITTGAGIDAYGGFPRLCPNGSGVSALLGNATASLSGGVGVEASGISYTYTIPAGISQFSIFFHYAVVLENPNHQPEAQPRFRARIRDLSTGNNIPCVDFDFTASSSLPGFVSSPINSSVLYKDWTPVTLNLTGLAGRTIELEFIVTECTQQGHFAYAYVDVNSNCNGAIQGSTICQGDNEITLTAPYGFQSYQWFSDPSFTTQLAATQSLYMNPAPSVGTTIPVIVVPYPGFGCRDTLYATITVSPKPPSNAGADQVICKNAQVQLGGPPTMGYQYEWTSTPAGQISNTTIANPVVSITGAGPERFIVRTTDILTGCFSRDTAFVTRFAVDTALTRTGPLDFCDEQSPTTLSLAPGLSAIQWYDASGPLPGANGQSFVPTVSGSYWAQVQQGGCTDSTRAILVNVHPLPQADFTINDDSLCVSTNQFSFTSTSSASDGSAMTHLWKFDDGSTVAGAGSTRSYPMVGTYPVELVSTTQWGCKDSIIQNVYVLPNGVPDFSWDSVCLNRPVQFLNLSNENGSAQVSYSWQFNDGGPGSTLQHPSPVVYTEAGKKDVILTMTTLGCEDDPQTVTKQIQVNSGHDAVRYRTITVPEGSTWDIHVRDTIGSIFAWRPQVQLTSYNTAYTEFIANGNDVEYLIDITDIHTCVTTDTILMQILKKPGFYLPTAFTPNSDGLNDLLRPYLVKMQSLRSFTIFNRWGQMLFRSTTYGEGWDGRFGGVDQDPGVYVWALEFLNTDGVLQREKGTVTLIR